jgi:YidC/Oxa1 family membrane protein insertase
MDIQRTGLLAILGIATYMLFLQWNVYTEEQDLAPDRVSVAAAQSSMPAVSSSDPSVPDVTSIDGESPATMITASQPGSNVRVQTPLFDITIDLSGGDITQALLPKFPTRIDRPNDPIALLDSVDRVYFAQSGLVGPDGPDASPAGRPVYRTSAESFTITEPTDVVLETTTETGLTVQKIYHFNPNQYDIKVTHRITNTGTEQQIVTPFVQLKRDNTADPSIQNSMGMQAFLGFALQTADERYRKIGFNDFETSADAQDLNADLNATRIDGGYLALLQHYFTTAWVPAADQTHRYSFRKNDRGENIGSIVSPQLVIAPNSSVEAAASLYIGPKDQDALEALTPGLELVVDYGWLWFIAQPLFWCLKFIQTYVGNWGLAIILVTILVKGAFFQLSAAAYRSMAKMRKFTPEITRLREMYGDDRQRMSKEMMDLYKREKINPLGGCLPILVQMPVFIALYWVLLESVELRQAPFMLWINDLSAKDPYFILPLLMGISMYIQTSLNPTPPDPMQAKIMKYMPVAFTFFFLWFPAGLVLYWVVNNILSIAQQWVITRAIEKQQTA